MHLEKKRISVKYLQNNKYKKTKTEQCARFLILNKFIKLIIH